MRKAILFQLSALVFLLACSPQPDGAAAQQRPEATTGQPREGAAAPTLTGERKAAAEAKLTRVKPETVRAMLEKRITEQPAFVPGEVIVKIKENAPLQPMNSAASRLRLEVKRAQTSGRGEMVYRLPPAMIGAMSERAQSDRTLAAVRELSQRPDVEYAQPNFRFQIAVNPNDLSYPLQWHYFSSGNGTGQAPGGVNLPQAWDGGTGASAVVVAVIDTGILPTHEDIVGSPNLVPTRGFDMISEPEIANDGDGRDADPTDPGDAVAANECGPGSRAQPDSWHGTHVAGTIGVGRTNNGVGVAGVNWSVKVVVVRVLGKCGGTMVDINDGIRWAAGLAVPGVPINPNPAKIINMSLGGGSPCAASPATQSAINDAVAAGATVVVAAGNEAMDASGFLPASCANVVTVAASDRRGRLVDRYSNFGARVDILAPGGDVARDDDGDGNPDGVLSMVKGGYDFYNGTSMAAPHVAGVAALFLAQDPTRTSAQIINLLKSRAVPIGPGQCSKPCGVGLLSAIEPDATPPTPTPPTPPTPTTNVTVEAKLSKAKIKIGESVELSATVERGGAPDAGKTVAFASHDTSIATVSPVSATTDASGKVTVQVTGVAEGTTEIDAQSGGQTGSDTVRVVKKMAALPLGFAVVLFLAIVVLVGAQAFRKRAV